MWITPMCKALALHEIFDRRGIGAGGALLLDEIEQEWARSGLRCIDLDDTFADARTSGEFELRETAEGCVVMLTQVGYEHAQRDLSDLREIDDLIRAYAVLSAARRRQPAGPAYGRRRSDPLVS